MRKASVIIDVICFIIAMVWLFIGDSPLLWGITALACVAHGFYVYLSQYNKPKIREIEVQPPTNLYMMNKFDNEAKPKPRKK